MGDERTVSFVPAADLVRGYAAFPRPSAPRKLGLLRRAVDEP